MDGNRLPDHTSGTSEEELERARPDPNILALGSRSIFGGMRKEEEVVVVVVVRARFK